MRILEVSIENFRGVKKATIRLPSHALILGPNNAGKSTILEAIDLVLGPDRIRGPDAINEHDFHEGDYLYPEDGPNDAAMRGVPDANDQGAPASSQAAAMVEEADVQSAGGEAADAEGEMAEVGGHEEGFSGDGPEIRIEVVLGDLNADEIRIFRGHIEPWHPDEFRLLTREEAEHHEPETDDFVLRVECRAWYDRDLDEFEAETVFLSPDRPGGGRAVFGRRHKQSVGFLYLRSLRTGRRAATLERGSLLDVLLREKQARPQLWEFVLQALRAGGSELEKDVGLSEALGDIRASIHALTPLSTSIDSPSSLQIGRLTRRHLRQIITYFLASRDSNHPLPFNQLGSGTSNVLVFGLLGAIAAVKDNVIFAMEEPEIALPPHTQRVVIRRLKQLAQQAIVTSHSPYVAEQFLPDGLLAVRRSGDAELSCSPPATDEHVKEKTLRRDFRTRFAEGLLARTVVLVEGVTELWALPAAVDVLAAVPGTTFNGLDLDGVVFVPAGGTGDLPSLAGYFASLGIPVIIVCDQLAATDDHDGLERIASALIEHRYGGFEQLVADELAFDLMRTLSTAIRGWPDYPHHLTVPDREDGEGEWRAYFLELLKVRKGEGYAARMLSMCRHEDLPPTVIRILARVRAASGAAPLESADPLADMLAPPPEAAAE